ncbi:hypothetical protein L249_8312, partial [Ophiocordyceps polyrhachis-furcata BCC 54312]
TIYTATLGALVTVATWPEGVSICAARNIYKVFLLDEDKIIRARNTPANPNLDKSVTHIANVSKDNNPFDPNDFFYYYIPNPYLHPPEHSAYSGVGDYSGRVIAVIAGIMGIISISFSHLLNTNTSPASNSSLIASFRLLRDSSSSSLLRDYLPDSSTLYLLLV